MPGHETPTRVAEKSKSKMQILAQLLQPLSRFSPDHLSGNKGMLPTATETSGNYQNMTQQSLIENLPTQTRRLSTTTISSTESTAVCSSVSSNLLTELDTRHPFFPTHRRSQPITGFYKTHTLEMLNENGSDESLTLKKTTATPYQIKNENERDFLISDFDESYDDWDPWWNQNSNNRDFKTKSHYHKNKSKEGIVWYTEESNSDTDTDTMEEEVQSTYFRNKTIDDHIRNLQTRLWEPINSDGSKVRLNTETKRKNSLTGETKLKQQVIKGFEFQRKEKRNASLFSGASSQPYDIFSPRSASHGVSFYDCNSESPTFFRPHLVSPIRSSLPYDAYSLPPAELEFDSVSSKCLSNKKISSSLLSSQLVTLKSDTNSSFEKPIQNLDSDTKSSMIPLASELSANIQTNDGIQLQQSILNNKTQTSESIGDLIEKAEKLITSSYRIPSNHLTSLKKSSDVSHSPSNQFWSSKCPKPLQSPSEQSFSTLAETSESQHLESEDSLEIPLTESNAIYNDVNITIQQNTQFQSGIDRISSELAPSLSKTKSRPNHNEMAISTIIALLNATAAAATISNTKLSQTFQEFRSDDLSDRHPKKGSESFTHSIYTNEDPYICSLECEEGMKSEKQASEFAKILDPFTINPSQVISAAALAAKASATILKSEASLPFAIGIQDKMDMYLQQYKALSDLHKVLSDVTKLLRNSSLNFKPDSTINADTNPLFVEDETQLDSNEIKATRIQEDKMQDNVNVPVSVVQVHSTEKFFVDADKEIINLEPDYDNIEVLVKTTMKEECKVIDELTDVYASENHSANQLCYGEHIISEPKSSSISSSVFAFEPQSQLVLNSLLEKKKRETMFESAVNFCIPIINFLPLQQPLQYAVKSVEISEKTIISILCTSRSLNSHKQVRFSKKDLNQVISFNKLDSPNKIRESDVMLFEDTNIQENDPFLIILTPQNFTFFPSNQELHIRPVHINILVSGGGTIWGSVLVKNLAFHKRVFVRFTFDKWEHKAEIEATYTRSTKLVIPMDCEPEFDNFYFNLNCFPLFEDITAGHCCTSYDSTETTFDLEFAVRYEFGENVLWENNNDSNYAVKLSRVIPKKKFPSDISESISSFEARSMSFWEQGTQFIDQFLDDDIDLAAVAGVNLFLFFLF
ncbi:hypothetical protein HK096_000267 [Nowakowskiella sp. JEL0078]|nr:hypothetical protein HK096_000267 [Nowakowskiella sp. JEL0078]